MVVNFSMGSPEEAKAWDWQLMGSERVFSGSEYVQCGEVPFDLSSRPFTIEARFKLNDLNSSYGILSNMTDSSSNEGISLYFDPDYGDNRVIQCRIGYSSYYRAITSTKSLDFGEWYHAAVVWDSEIVNQGGDPIIRFCNIGSGWYGRGNLSDNPLFVDPDKNDYRIQHDSPCRNRGDGSVSWLPGEDIEGEPRISAGQLDMGADEFLSR